MSTTHQGKGLEFVLQKAQSSLIICGVQHNNGRLPSNQVVAKIHLLPYLKLHQNCLQMCFRNAWTDLWPARPPPLHARTAAAPCACSLPCVFLAVIQLNLSYYPTLLKRQIPDATLQSLPATDVWCLFAWVAPECLRQILPKHKPPAETSTPLHLGVWH